ncbi:hypothetical protein Bca52824_084146 [Brassica carinata]|uniref:Uncharacterized protein n=1 Tax=Brassica carinata TaxID=52824 RepID=A0A8X7TTF9_BRACI|nr:hypothetical protein Bca52824_084146 [Brassica carinata]
MGAAVCTHGLEEVKDSNGNPVNVGAQYFIQPVKTESNNGGGLVPAAINILPFCPLGITQTLLPYQPGLPLWAVDDSSSAKEPAIIIGGKLERPNSAFKIEKATGAHTYKLTTSYGTVGTTPGAWLSAPQLLVTNDVAKTLYVKFVKVDDDASTATTTTTSRVEKLGLRMFPFY